MAKRYINIQFPFQDDAEGKFLKLNSDSKKAIKADLVHLLLTNKGERLYMPDFGANLRRYLFEPNDTTSTNAIKNEISEAVRKFIPNLTITELTTSPVEGNEHAVTVRIDYVVTTGAFQSSDFVTLQL
jgi:phage baseplate assembly protein W